MKNKIIVFVLFALFLKTSAFTQTNTPIKKIHAYKQASIPGIKPAIPNDDENKLQNSKPASNNYWIYVEISRFSKVFITDIWITGTRLKVKSETITDLPVIKIDYLAVSGMDTIILVPATANKVILISPKGFHTGSFSASKYLTDLVSKNELVIGYLFKGKKYFKALKTIIMLEPEARQ